MPTLKARIAHYLHLRRTPTARERGQNIELHRIAPARSTPRTEDEIQTAVEIIELSFATPAFIDRFKPKLLLTKKETRQLLDVLHTSPDVRKIANAAKSLIAAGQTRTIVLAGVDKERFEPLVARTIDGIRDPYVLQCKYWRSNDADAALYRKLETAPRLGTGNPATECVSNKLRLDDFKDLNEQLRECAELMTWRLADLCTSSKDFIHDSNAAKNITGQLQNDLARSLEYMMFARIPGKNIISFLKATFRNCVSLAFTVGVEFLCRGVIPGFMEKAIIHGLSIEEIVAGLDKLAGNPQILSEAIAAYSYMHLPPDLGKIFLDITIRQIRETPPAW